jgi:hypothetical protein
LRDGGMSHTLSQQPPPCSSGPAPSPPPPQDPVEGVCKLGWPGQLWCGLGRARHGPPLQWWCVGWGGQVLFVKNKWWSLYRSLKFFKGRVAQGVGCQGHPTSACHYPHFQEPHLPPPWCPIGHWGHWGHHPQASPHLALASRAGQGCGEALCQVSGPAP